MFIINQHSPRDKSVMMESGNHLFLGTTPRCPDMKRLDTQNYQICSRGTTVKTKNVNIYYKYPVIWKILRAL